MGLLGILIGEQAVPIGKQIMAGSGLSDAWRQPEKCAPHIFGMLPGRHAGGEASTVNAAEKAS